MNEGVSAADAICAAVRRRIIDGQYAFGERITEEQVAADFGASRTSVREALRVLSAEGFLSVRPYFGTFVGTLSPQQASELLEVQGGLEAMAAELAARRRSEVDVYELRRTVEQGRLASAAADAAGSAKLHAQFHSLLTRAAGNETLADVMRQIRDKVDWVYASSVRRPARDAWEEHSRIVDAIDVGDPALAAEVARDHVQHGSQARAND